MSDFIVQDRIKFEMAIHISGWARVVHAEYFFSPKLWFEVIFCTITASCMLYWIDVVILLLRFLRIGGKIEMMIYLPAWVWNVHKAYSFVYTLSQVHLLAQFVCHMLCSSGRIDTLTCVDARRNWIDLTPHQTLLTPARPARRRPGSWTPPWTISYSPPRPSCRRRARTTARRYIARERARARRGGTTRAASHTIM